LGTKDTRPKAWLKIAFTFIKSGLYTNAADAYSKVLEDEPNNIQALLGISICLMAEHKAEDALSYLLKAERIDRRNPEVQFQLGRAYYATGEKKRALKALKEALELDPSLKDAENLTRRIERQPKYDEIEKSKLLYEEGLRYFH